MSTLPQLIGPTERLLTRVLFERGLAGLRIGSNPEWVALNRLDGFTATESHVAQLAGLLSIELSDARDVLAALAERGLIDRHGDQASLTDAGRNELREARRRVASLTAELEQDVTPEDRAVVERVLDRIRTRGAAILAPTA